jgi:hypothetical protein
MKEAVNITRKGHAVSEHAFSFHLPFTLQNYLLTKVCQNATDVLAIIFKANITKEPELGLCENIWPSFHETNIGENL